MQSTKFVDEYLSFPTPFNPNHRYYRKSNSRNIRHFNIKFCAGNCVFACEARSRLPGNESTSVVSMSKRKEKKKSLVL